MTRSKRRLGTLATVVALTGYLFLGGTGVSSASTHPATSPLVGLPTLTKVESLLAAAGKESTLPNPTIPALGSGFSGPSVPELNGQSNCGAIAGAPADITSETPCVFGDPSATRSLVIVGDSEADTWVPTLDTWGQGEKWKIYRLVKDGCAPWDDSIDSGWAACQTFKKFEITEILALKPNVVIADGMAVTGQTGPVTINVTKEADAIEGFATEIKSIHATVLIPNNLPWEYQYPSPQTCLAANTSNIKTCNNYSRSSVVSSSMASAILKASSSKKVTELPTDELVCSPSKCPIVEANRLIMADNHHITSEWGEFIASAFNQIISPHLPKGS